MSETIQKESGSFRDPSGFVFRYHNQIYRCVDEPAWLLVEEIGKAGVLGDLVRKDLIVDTKPVDEGSALYKELGALLGNEHAHILAHEQIPVISYPSELSYAMLADAGLLHLLLQTELFEKGLSLKDASAFNVQFKKGRPVFIDIPSIEHPAKFNAWIAYGQFCRMFLFPLVLKLYRGYDIRDCFLAHIDGMDVGCTYKMLGPMQAWRPSLFIDVLLQYFLQEHSSGNKRIEELAHKKDYGSHKSGDPEIQIANLNRLERKLLKLRERLSSRGQWIKYSTDNSYSAKGEDEKADFIREFIGKYRPATVLDMGCNTGRFSRIAAEGGSRVVAVDSDHDCVDMLYREAREKDLNILPLHMEIGSPTPAMGFMNEERRSFLGRIDCDCLFMLAVVHHLLVSGRIPLDSIREMCRKLAKRWLIIEFVPVEDPMFKKLLELRENIYGHITRKYFEDVMGACFRLLSCREITGSKRILYAFEKI